MSCERASAGPGKSNRKRSAYEIGTQPPATSVSDFRMSGPRQLSLLPRKEERSRSQPRVRGISRRLFPGRSAAVIGNRNPHPGLRARPLPQAGEVKHPSEAASSLFILALDDVWKHLNRRSRALPACSTSVAAASCFRTFRTFRPDAGNRNMGTNRNGGRMYRTC